MGPLPVDPADVAADEGAHARLEALCRIVSPVLAAAPIKAWQACFRPVTEDGLLLIGAVPGVDGGFVATGHSVWGMLNAPATGEAMSELILDGVARHVDLTPFAPGRLPPFDPARPRDLAEGRGYYPIEHPPAFDAQFHDQGNVSRLNVIKVPSRSTCHPTSPRIS